MICDGERTSVKFLLSDGPAAARSISPDASYRALPAMGEAGSIFKSQIRVESLKASHDTD